MLARLYASGFFLVLLVVVGLEQFWGTDAQAFIKGLFELRHVLKAPVWISQRPTFGESNWWSETDRDRQQYADVKAEHTWTGLILYK